MEEKTNNRLTTIKKSLNYVGKILSTAVLVVLILIGLFLVYYVICAKVVSKTPGYEPPINLYTIVSGSMEPNIKVYDVVLDIRVDNPEDIKVGDVITFKSTSSISKDLIVTHRVIDIKKTGDEYEYVTKGDNNPTADSDTAKYNNVIGKVKMRFPQLGRIQFFIATKMGWFLVVLLPAMCVVIYDIIKIIKMLDTKRTSKKINNKPLNQNDDKENVLELRQLNETLEKIEHNNYENKINELQEQNTNIIDEALVSQNNDKQFETPQVDSIISNEDPIIEPNIPIINQEEKTMEIPSLKSEIMNDEKRE